MSEQSNTELYRQKALHHDLSDLPEISPEDALGRIEHTVVSGYKAVEHAVVSGYQTLENNVVNGFTKMTDHVVETFLTREGETVDEAKARMNQHRP